MDKVYFVRHQARGVLHELPFAEPPTDEQILALERNLAAVHGLQHPKTKEPYWIRVVAVEVRGPDFVIPVPKPSAATKESKVDLQELTVSAVGHVSDPEG